MAKKKDLCLSCKKFDAKNQSCKEEKLKEIVIINRKEYINDYIPNKETQCKYYEDAYVTTDEPNP